MRKNLMELIGIPVQEMRHREPMIPLVFTRWEFTRSNVEIPNRDYNIVDIEFRGEDSRAEKISFNVVLKTVYTDRQLMRRIKKASAIYILNMRLYIVDEYGDCRRVPNTYVDEYCNRCEPGSHYTRLRGVNGVIFPLRK